MQKPFGRRCGKDYRKLDYQRVKTFSSTSARLREGSSYSPKLAAELVAAKVDVLVALYTPCATAAQEATRDIPIVAIAANPVETGLIVKLGPSGQKYLRAYR